MKQLTRLAKELPTLRTAELVRCYGPHKPMAGRTWVALLDQLAPLGQGRQLATQPSQHPPNGAVVQKPSRIPGGDAGRILVNPRPASGTGRFAISLPVILQIAARKMEQGGTGVAFIGEYESRGNR